MKKNLLLSTSSFPFNSEIQEAFLIEELTQLSQNFNLIFICPSVNSGSLNISLPKNVKLMPIPKYLTFKWKLYAIILLFNRDFWDEFFQAKRNITIKNVFSLTREMLIFLTHAKKLKHDVIKIIKTQKINPADFIFYSYWLNYSALSFVYLKQKYPMIKTVSRIHSNEVYLHSNHFHYQVFKRKTMLGLSKLFCVSQFLKNYIITNYNLSSVELNVNRLGTKKQFLIAAPVRSGLKIISIGSADVKRISLLESALKKITDISIEWHHFGSQNYSNKNNSLPKTLKFIHQGFLSNSLLLSKIKCEKYDFLINVSKSEGIPVSIMEAMSFSVPVIATNVGGTSEIVTNENGQLLNSTPSIEEICNAIRNFHNLSAEEVVLKKQAAYKTWKKKYNATKNYTQFVEDILSL